MKEKENRSRGADLDLDLWRLKKAVVGYFGSHEDAIDLAFSRFDFTISWGRG
jgi:hypothetical protein